MIDVFSGQLKWLANLHERSVADPALVGKRRAERRMFYSRVCVSANGWFAGHGPIYRTDYRVRIHHGRALRTGRRVVRAG